MRGTSRLLPLTAALVVGALLAGGGYAIGAGSAQPIHGCVVSGSHQLLIKRHCTSGEAPLVWNRQGPQGQIGQTGPQGPPGAAAWATVLPGVSSAITLDGQNLTVHQDGNGVFTLTAEGSCSDGLGSEVVTPSANNVDPIGVPVAYVVNANGPPNVFRVVTGGLSTTGGFTQGNGQFGVAVFCKAS
jgi:hypothetical protein